MKTRLLTREELLATYGEPMTRIDPDEGMPAFDFWPYFDSIPREHFEGQDCSAGLVEWIYREPGGRFETVAVNSTKPNKFMVIVLNIEEKRVHGHKLLDLDKEYGLET
jgi:hypothetical protein